MDPLFFPQCPSRTYLKCMISVSVQSVKTEHIYFCYHTIENNCDSEKVNITNKKYKHAHSKFHSFGHSWHTVLKHSGTVLGFFVLLCTDRVFLPGTDAELFHHLNLVLKEKVCLETQQMQGQIMQTGVNGVKGSKVRGQVGTSPWREVFSCLRESICCLSRLCVEAQRLSFPLTSSCRESSCCFNAWQRTSTDSRGVRHILFQVSLKVHCFKWQGNFGSNKSIKIKAMLLIISLSTVVCFWEGKKKSLKSLIEFAVKKSEIKFLGHIAPPKVQERSF